MDRKELAELILAFLYTSAEEAPHSFFFFNITDFARKIGVTDTAEILDAADMIEQAGYACLMMNGPGNVSALINDAGFCYVDEGGETGIIGRYRKDPQEFLSEAGAGESDTALNVKRITLGNDIYSLLVRASDVVKKDNDLDTHTREGALRNIDMLTSCLGGLTEDSRTIISETLAKLAGVPGLVDITRELEILIGEFLDCS